MTDFFFLSASVDILSFKEIKFDFKMKVSFDALKKYVYILQNLSNLQFTYHLLAQSISSTLKQSTWSI